MIRPPACADVNPALLNMGWQGTSNKRTRGFSLGGWRMRAAPVQQRDAVPVGPLLLFGLGSELAMGSTV